MAKKIDELNKELLILKSAQKTPLIHPVRCDSCFNLKEMHKNLISAENFKIRPGLANHLCRDIPSDISTRDQHNLFLVNVLSFIETETHRKRI